MAANTEKVSVTLSGHTLGLAKAAAARTGVSFSSLVNQAIERHLREVVADLERERAGLSIVNEMPKENRASPEDERELLALCSRGHVPSEEEIDAAIAWRAKPAGSVARPRQIKVQDRTPPQLRVQAKKR